MSIGPIKGISPTNLPSSLTSDSHSSARRSNLNARDAARARQAASDQIIQAERDVERAQIEANRRLEGIEDRNDAQVETALARKDERIETIREEGYQRIRDLKRNFEKQERQASQDGERSLQKLNQHYRTNEKTLRNRFDENQKELQDTQLRTLNYQKNRLSNEKQLLEQQRKDQIETIHQRTDEKIRSLKRSAQNQSEIIESKYQDEGQKSEKKFKLNFERKLDQQKDLLERLNERTQNEIHSIRDRHRKLLTAYDSRGEDPFYQLIDLDSELREEEEGYRLIVNIPKHEKNHLKATVQGQDKLIISGHRSNQENHSDQKGHEVGTSTFQTFHESFDLDWPVDRQKLRRIEYEDRIEIFVPKLGPHAKKTRSHIRPKEVEPSRPQFPSNLGMNPPAGSGKDKHRPGGGTLL